jgi:hypothetical protein
VSPALLAGKVQAEGWLARGRGWLAGLMFSAAIIPVE